MYSVICQLYLNKAFNTNKQKMISSIWIKYNIRHWGIAGR